MLPEDNPFEESVLSELIDSVREHGILQPLLVRKIDSKYQLIAGERRYNAARFVGLKEVPVLIREMTDAEAQIFAIVENAQRKNLNLVQDALIGRQIIALHLDIQPEQVGAYLTAIHTGRRPDDRNVSAFIARVFGNTLSTWLNSRLPLLKLTESEQQALLNGVPFVLLKPLLKLDPDHPERSQLLKRIEAGELTTQELKAEIERLVGRNRSVSPMQQLGLETKMLLPKLSSLQGSDLKRAERLLKELNQLLGKLS
ncbi:ParB/RepB/Spo0J family partition protein [Deinococcus aquatilis]|uniref:ParB/RepB/Spo0J family partition protein n=1 Tax=Deinococcus aquatilis TaxID=519440 RepID=UPI00146C0E5C|nr:ParB/RepB/Spo0J family partition protein [Deinococcus aquatilis]